MSSIGPPFYEFVRKLEENGGKPPASINSRTFPPEFQFDNSTCYLCNGYYGSNYGEPTCVTCHNFLYPDFPHHLLNSFMFSEKKDDGDSGNDEPSAGEFLSNERRLKKALEEKGLPNWAFKFQNSLNREASPEEPIDQLRSPRCLIHPLELPSGVGNSGIGPSGDPRGCNGGPNGDPNFGGPNGGFNNDPNIAGPSGWPNIGGANGGPIGGPNGGFNNDPNIAGHSGWPNMGGANGGPIGGPNGSPNFGGPNGGFNNDPNIAGPSGWPNIGGANGGPIGGPNGGFNNDPNIAGHSGWPNMGGANGGPIGGPNGSPNFGGPNGGFNNDPNIAGPSGWPNIGGANGGPNGGPNGGFNNDPNIAGPSGWPNIGGANGGPIGGPNGGPNFGGPNGGFNIDPNIAGPSGWPNIGAANGGPIGGPNGGFNNDPNIAGPSCWPNIGGAYGGPIGGPNGGPNFGGPNGRFNNDPNIAGPSGWPNIGGANGGPIGEPNGGFNNDPNIAGPSGWPNIGEANGGPIGGPNGSPNFGGPNGRFNNDPNIAGPSGWPNIGGANGGPIDGPNGGFNNDPNIVGPSGWPDLGAYGGPYRRFNNDPNIAGPNIGWPNKGVVNGVPIGFPNYHAPYVRPNRAGLSRDAGLGQPVPDDGRHSPLSANLAMSIAALSTPRLPDNLAPGLVDQLPAEVLLWIFSYLDDLSLNACALVCERWLSLVRAHVPQGRWADFTRRRWPLFRPMANIQNWQKKYQDLVDSVFCHKCLVQMFTLSQPPYEENAWRRNRLRNEIKMLRTSPPEGCAATPLDPKCCHWQAMLTGPVGSPYEGGVFFLYIQIPFSYPMSPPVVRFLTRILHPNVSRHGDVGIDSVHHNWSLALTISKLLISIQSLLTDPYTTVCMEPEIGEMYVNDRVRFNRIARRWTWYYAMHDMHFGDLQYSP